MRVLTCQRPLRFDRVCREPIKEEPLRLKPLTGLSPGQIAELALRVARQLNRPLTRPGGRPSALGLHDSVAPVVYLVRKNPTQEEAAAVFDVSQATVSRRWDLLRPLIGKALACEVLPPARIGGAFGTYLVDGTICPTWDWRAVPDLYSTKAGYPGMNVQIAANLDGRIAAVGPIPVHGARHDAHAYAASGLAELLADLHTMADLGYVGVEGVDLVPVKRLPGCDLHERDATFNKGHSGIRAAVERAVAHFKCWRMFSEEGGRFRAPIDKFAETLTTTIGLLNFARSHEAYE
jgi:hypothetical protein